MKHYLLKLPSYLLVIFTPVVPTICWLLIFIGLDLFTGIWKARKEKQPITSRRMSRTVTKSLMYFIAIIASQVMDTQFLKPDLLPVKIVQLMAGYLAVMEFKSILENIGAILGQPVWQALKKHLYRKEN